MQKVLAVLLIVTLSACSSAVKFSTRGGNRTQSPRNEPVVMKNIPEPGSDVLEVFEGVASYYADKFHGRTTANGETYNMYDLTAAHNSFAFNTIIRVTNRTNGRSCIIRINDRMPHHPNRIIDLSLGTARELDMVNAGLANVRLEILKWGDR